jgi:NDP-sugar pyrophosphorylase family protein
MNRIAEPETLPVTESAIASLDRVTAVLLVGGLGTRLRQVIHTTPKPLATIGRASFLELLLRQLRHQGIRHVVMCTGYLGEQVTKQFGTGAAWDLEIEYSQEPHPLGTAGAVKFAEALTHGASDFVVMNGDSFIEMDLRHFLRFHQERGGMATLAVRRVEDASRYGLVHVGGNGKVAEFAEKSNSNIPGLVNAGAYVFNREVLRHIPAGRCSLELDVFPKLVAYGVYALEQQGTFIDIGTPEDYSRAQRMCEGLYKAALDPQYSN